MKKILIASSYIPPVVGGAERVTWEIATGLKKRFDVHILTTGSGYFDEMKENLTIHYVPYKYPLSLYYATLGKKYLDEIFSKHDFDLLSIQLVLPWGYLLRKYPMKRVITDHALGAYVYKRNRILESIDRHKAGIAFRRASLTISSSKWSIEKLEKDFSIDVQFMPNGINLEKYHMDNSNEKHNVILFYGRFIEMKGIKYLLDAARKLPMYEFWFIGKGPLESIIKGENIKNFGFVDKPEDFIRKATICIFPSFIEASPLVGLEAMACGKPVIATSAGFSEYIEHMKDGLIIEAKSTRAIIDSINCLMNDKGLRTKMGENARIKAEQYSWDIICDRYADLFEEIIEEKA